MTYSHIKWQIDNKIEVLLSLRMPIDDRTAFA